MSFSQRRFLGFRNRYEFDKKRIIFASKRDFVVVGYDYEKRVYELLRSFVNYDEEIRFISFLEDNVPSYLFLICWNKKE
jgi:WD40 repeat protein